MPLPVIAVVGAAVAGAAALAKGITGAVQAAKAKKALKNFQRQELKNITGGMRVSSLEAQFNTQEAQRRFDTSVDALRSGGVRGVVGGLGRQEMLAQNVQQRASAGLDQQQVMIDRMRAQDEARIQGIQEQRDSFDIGQLAGQQAAGRAQIGSALGDVAGIASSFISPAGQGTPKNNTTLMSQTGLKAQEGLLGSAQFATERGGFLGLGNEQSVFKGFEGIKPIVPDYTIKPIGK